MDTLELFNGDNSCKIRSAFIEGKGYIFSIYDFINLACGKDINVSYSRKTFDRISQVTNCHLDKYTFEKGNNKPTPVTNIRQLQQILIQLPGENGKKYRDIAESTVTRVMAGDLSLKDIIDSNYVSNDTINIVARDTLDKNPYDKSNDLFLQGRIDKLTQKVTKLKLLNEQKDIALREKDNKLEQKDTIISTLCSSNNILVKANDKIKNTNTKLKQNYASVPESNLLVEYLVIVRKNKDNFQYEEIVKEVEEIDLDLDIEIRKEIEKDNRNKFIHRVITTNCKHYKNVTYNQHICYINVT
jgi:hypothetical protein